MDVYTSMAAMFPEIPDLKIDGYTVIVPSVSIGGVPQLTVDLLVDNINPVFVGSIYVSDLVSVVGPNVFDSESKYIASACEGLVENHVTLKIEDFTEHVPF